MGFVKDLFNIPMAERARLTAHKDYDKGKITFRQLAEAVDACIEAYEHATPGTTIRGVLTTEIAETRRIDFAKPFGISYKELSVIAKKLDLTKDQMAAQAAEINRLSPATTRPSSATGSIGGKGPRAQP